MGETQGGQRVRGSRSRRGPARSAALQSVALGRHLVDTWSGGPGCPKRRSTTPQVLGPSVSAFVSNASLCVCFTLCVSLCLSSPCISLSLCPGVFLQPFSSFSPGPRLPPPPEPEVSSISESGISSDPAPPIYSRISWAPSLDGILVPMSVHLL